MSYSPEDAAMDVFYARLSDELYPEHREQAIEEFTAARLQSYYLKNPELAMSGRRMFRQSKKLYRLGYLGPELV